jgi:manganese-dependent ADP-ribose/CDP-alcohol diphosphatase
MVWDFPEVYDLLRDFTCVKAIICGHDHSGGYTLDNGVHHITFPSPLNVGSDGYCHGHIDVFDDRLEVTGKGLVKSLTCKFKNNSANL